MTVPTQIDDDLQRILAFARAALSARDDAVEWARSRSGRSAITRHAAALWEELERLVDREGGKVPVIEHPALKERRVARRLRARIVAEILDIARERLDHIIDGGFGWEDPGSMTREEVEDLYT